MAERPILFNGAMVRAILTGRKTQTRRAVKGEALEWLGISKFGPEYVATPGNDLCPFGHPGDRLWVRETWTNAWDEERNQWTDPERYHYRADGIEAAHVDGMGRSPWIPSIHMPRRACRLVLEITDVRVERLQAISEADARAEGVDPEMPDECALAFDRLWTSINGPASWPSDPWVWVIEFKRVEVGK
ncbi:TPA: hypothetical protein ACKP5X_000585 [Stenotrophomonas maltophilia]